MSILEVFVGESWRLETKKERFDTHRPFLESFRGLVTSTFFQGIQISFAVPHSHWTQSRIHCIPWRTVFQIIQHQPTRSTELTVLRALRQVLLNILCNARSRGFLELKLIGEKRGGRHCTCLEMYRCSLPFASSLFDGVILFSALCGVPFQLNPRLTDVQNLKNVSADLWDFLGVF